jgi:flagellar biosynthesis protein FlhF
MELKRILARDTRSATEQALHRFGPNVFVISNQRLGGQTELVVAVDVEAAKPQDDEVVAPVAEATEGRSFRESLQTAHQPLPADDRPQPPSSGSTTPHSVGFESGNDRDLIRSREIVATVREEIAALRQEFRLSQKALLWRAEHAWPEEIQPLVQGLSEASVPASLRTLLMDLLREQTHLSTAIDHLVQHLVTNMPHHHVAAPVSGIHVLAGPSGAGKTTMTARLVRHALQSLSPDQVAVITFRDQRAGAWAQTQTLSAQVGVDCFRAKDAEMLTALLAELSQRQLILIDTPGVQLQDNISTLRGLCPTALWHAVLPVDVSAVTLRRVLVEAGATWESILVTKLDESNAPWPLLQHLMQTAGSVGLSMASGSERIGEGLQVLSSELLAELAVAQWMPDQPVNQALIHGAVESSMELH